MGKLYPPTIPGTIPAFYGTSIEVPFSMNRAVGLSEFNGFALKIKKVSGVLVGTVFEDSSETWIKNGAIKFQLPTLVAEQLVQGQFYKIQIAYTKRSGTSRTVGIYSTIGVVKYTTMPMVSIENMDDTVVNNHIYSYTGVYRQVSETYSNGVTNIDWSTKDTTEKMYSSRFVIYDTDSNIVKDSGEILHNTINDTNAYESSETYMIPEDLELNKIYYLYYIVTTINGMVVTSPRYRITQRRQIPMSLEGSITAQLNYDAGTIDIYLKGKYENQVSSGLFLLSRRGDNDPNGWEELYYFSLQSEIPDRLLFTDYTVAQGVNYVYSLQQYNTHNVFSDRMFSNNIIADFEDLFLFDGQRQLKVKFNPKVSTFKPNVVESKTNTLGSKHPFIVRNGDVNYKEFSISGLISYQMDDIDSFLSKSTLGLEFATHNLVTENIKAERDFKLAVLEWLNDGQPKLFRSPTEGNYIVRLMNVTMSPNDTLGRMLHTFNCSAYEVDDYNYENLHKHGLISVINDTKYQMRWATIKLADMDLSHGMVKYFTGQINIGNNYGESAVRPVYHLEVTEMMPGTYFLLGDSEESAQKVYIGTTGSYEVHSEKPYNYVGIPEEDDDGNPIQWEGMITYGYKSQVTSLFDLITNVSINDIPCQRIIGHTGDSLLASLQDIKTTILAIRYVAFSLRGHYPVYVAGGGFDPESPETWVFHADSNNSAYYGNTLEYPGGMALEGADGILKLSLLDKWNLYKIYRRREDYSKWTLQDDNGDFNPTGEGYYVDKHGDYFTPFTGYYYDPMSNQVLPAEDIFSVNINGEVADLSETEHLYVSGIDNYEILKAGAGIVTDIGYQSQTSTYSFETTNFEIAALKQTYLTNLKNYLADRKVKTASNGEVKHAYMTFINKLTEVVTKYKEENSID
jgi:hypothetical protein